jgi:hypothetical protein
MLFGNEAGQILSSGGQAPTCGLPRVQEESPHGPCAILRVPERSARLFGLRGVWIQRCVCRHVVRLASLAMKSGI